eukprot:scaffold666500_cov94-Prasinocladus_malaysianus.AAC.1
MIAYDSTQLCLAKTSSVGDVTFYLTHTDAKWMLLVFNNIDAYDGQWGITIEIQRVTAGLSATPLK